MSIITTTKRSNIFALLRATMTISNKLFLLEVKQTSISNVVRTTHVWNFIYQVRSIAKQI
jgi:hypothetical protein